MFDERAFIEEFQKAQTPSQIAEKLRDPKLDEERALRLYLGDDRFQRLHSLAVRLVTARATRAIRGDGQPAEQRPPNVIVLPGIMGSELTAYEARTSTLIWVSYWHLFRGWMDRLRLDDQGRLPFTPSAGYDVRASNILTKYYAELILRLGQNYNARPFWYDWRKDLDVSATELEAFIKAQFGDEPYYIVAHSMGGLVARTMLRLRQRPEGGDYLRGLKRLVMLGTPNHGSFEVPLIFAGIQDTVRDLVHLTGGVGGLLDPGPTLTRLQEVMDSFPGIYQMMPWPKKLPDQTGLDRLYDAKTYDAFNRSVSQQHLDAALKHHAWLSGMIDKERMVYVAGYDQPTVTSVVTYDQLNQESAYSISRDGDGRVPHALGLLDSVQTYFVRGEHGKLPEHPQILAAIDDLLTKDVDKVDLPKEVTRSLGRGPGEKAAAHLEWTSRRAEEQTNLVEMMRRVESRDARFASRGIAEVQDLADGRPAPLLSPDERRLEELLTRSFVGGDTPAVPSALPAPANASVAKVRLRLANAELQKYVGQPDDKPAVDSIAVGHYFRVRPSTSLLDLDRVISMALGAKDHTLGSTPAERESLQEKYLLTQYIERGTLRGDLGVPFVLPDPRSKGKDPTDRIIVIAGMGVVGQLGVPELTVLARELCWSLSRLGKRHLATVLIGAGQNNLPASEAVAAFIDGVGQALNNPDGRGLECITFVEADPRRMEMLDGELQHVCSDLRVRRQLQLDYAPLDDEARKRFHTEGFEWEKLEWQRKYEDWQRQRDSGDDGRDHAPTRISVGMSQKVYTFGAMTKDAAVPERRVAVDPKLVEQTNDALVATDDPTEHARLGRVLSRLLVPDDLRSLLFTQAPLVLMVDATTARIHWELAVQDRTDAPGVAMPAKGGSFDRDAFLGTARGFTRQLRTQYSLPPEPPPPPARVLRVLVVADPAAGAHLPGAAQEGAEVADLFEAFNRFRPNVRSHVEVTRLFGPSEATRVSVMSAVLTGRFDILHFAGHCFFDPNDPPASGWLFGLSEVLSANELRRIDRVPKFVLSNACESGITPDRPEGRSDLMAPSFAEAFFERGVANFVCTAWPIDDAAARLFARYLYAALLGLRVADGPALRVLGIREPEPMYLAMREARVNIAESSGGGAHTWGAYQHYGNPYFRFFDRFSLDGQPTPQVSGQALPEAQAPGSTNGDKASDAGKPASDAAPEASRADFPDVQRVIARRDTELRRFANVIDVRPGYEFKNGWSTGKPAIVVTVLDKRPKDQLRPEEMLPETLDGVPVDVTPATPLEQLRAESPGQRGVGAAPLRGPEDDLKLPGIAPTSRALTSEEERALIPYKSPPDVSLDIVEAPMAVTCSVSPDTGWPVLNEFLSETEERLTVGMYDFTAPHVLKALLQDLKGPPKRELSLVLDPGLSLANGGDEDGNPKAGDITEDKVRDQLERALKTKFQFAWAAVKRAGKTTAGIFPSAYHIKVAVRDGKAFWLSSGNWQSSNQPPPDQQVNGQASPDDLSQFLKTFNREWHVVIDNEELADVFEKFLLWDFKQASRFQEEAGEREIERLPDLLVPIEELERGLRGQLQLFPRLDLPPGSPIRVQPLLTPDNYAEHALDLVKSARKSLYFQNQYIHVTLRQDNAFTELLQAVKDKMNDSDIDVRIILRDIGDTRKMLEAMEADGFDLSRVKVQPSCHTKGIIVDGETVLVGSHNWSSQGTTANRDASLIFFDPRVAQYYQKIFLHDWENLARQRVGSEQAMPRVAIGGVQGAAPRGMAIVPWDAYFED